jgi:hypothetical protein
MDIDSLLSPYGPASSYAAGGGSVKTHDITLLEPTGASTGASTGAPALIDAAASGKHRAEVPIDSMMVDVVPIQIGRLSA